MADKDSIVLSLTREKLARMEAEKLKRANEDPYADIYDGMPANLWRERSGADDDYEEPLF